MGLPHSELQTSVQKKEKERCEAKMKTVGDAVRWERDLQNLIAAKHVMISIPGLVHPG